ncbi:26S proteasome non-ATPase regulatory subunit 13-like [Rhopilema esculentum]|uniref:26S proteasome non-ATPase regulatory subunit 13-like n=1 Tax=Rhopilema esculentum TaxID=499914 RepID=UPI0031D9C0CF|eukprot:gene5422-595_t
MKEVQEFLVSKQQSDPEHSEQWGRFQQLYDKRLWHELTIEITEFLKEDFFKQNGGLVEIYEKFIKDFEHRLNPLSLTEMILIVAQELKDPEDKLKLFEKTKERVKSNAEGIVLLLTSIGRVKLETNQMDDVKTVINEAQAKLDLFDNITSVHGRFYDLSSNYFMRAGSFNKYYRDALRYLGCMDFSQLPKSELQQRAFSLSLAALLGDEVFNFGELLAHEVLRALQGTEQSWLVDLLYAFNSGDIKKFRELEPKWQTQSDLQSNQQKLVEKITLLALMELAFKRPSTERTIPFTTISEATSMPLNEVELIVMKALSLGLVKGSIDEVDQVVNITWVQPRVLDLNQINNMNTVLGSWCEKVKSSVRMVENQVPELLVSS